MKGIKITQVLNLLVLFLAFHLLIPTESSPVKFGSKKRNDKGLEKPKQDLLGAKKPIPLEPVEHNNLDEEEDMPFFPTKKATKKKPSRKRSKKRKVSRRKRINKVPAPQFPLLVGKPPPGLADDQKHSDDQSVDESLEAQKEAFESMLDENHKHPKLSKELHGDTYIILKYDSINRIYTITEEDSEEE